MTVNQKTWPIAPNCRRPVFLGGRQVLMGQCMGHDDCREAYWRDHDQAEALAAARGIPRFKSRHAVAR